MYYGAASGGTGRARGRDRTAAVAVVMLSAVVAAALVVSTRRDGRTVRRMSLVSPLVWPRIREASLWSRVLLTLMRTCAQQLLSRAAGSEAKWFSAKRSAEDLDSYFNSQQGGRPMLPCKSASELGKAH